jgi:hypothetical protein
MPSRSLDHFTIEWWPRIRGVLVALFVGVLLYVGFLKFWPNTPLVFKSVTVQQVVKPGELILYHAKYCRYSDAPATVARNVIGTGATAFTSPYPAISSVSKTGCGSVAVPLQLPSAMPKGSYELEVVATFQVNGLRSITVRAESNAFTVK